MALVYLGLGTNLGNKERNLNDVIAALSREVGEVLCQSAFYMSEPWGFTSDNNFLNVVVLVQTNESPFDVLEKTQQIERNMGRETKLTDEYLDRMMDIDILFYDNLIVDSPALKIPHPLIADRDFVLIPLSEIAPDLVHPVLNRKIIELLKS